MEKLDINKLLSWKDIINLGSNGAKYKYVNKNVLKKCCESNYKRKLLDENFKKYLVEPFLKEFPDCKIRTDYMNFSYTIQKNEDGTYIPKMSFKNFLASLIDEIFLNNTDSKIADFDPYKFLTEHEDNMKEAFLESVKEQKHIISSLRSYLNDNENNIIKVSYSHLDNIQHNVNNEEYLLNLRNDMNWIKHNYDRLEEYFNKEFPLEALNNVDKDKYLFVIAIGSSRMINSITTTDMDINKCIELIKDLIDANDSDLFDAINYLNNYCLIIDYLNSENDDDYYVQFNIESNGKMLGHDINDLRTHFMDFMKLMAYGKIDVINTFGLCTSKEDLLAKKAKETWKRIQNAKLVRNIKLNFEMIASGERISLNKNSDIMRRVKNCVSSNEKRQAKLKHDYDLVEEKMEYFESKEPLIRALGINEFKGYFANFYQNGVVVLDRYFRETIGRKGQVVTTPATNEAIYVINYQEFADLSLLKKMELIKEKVEYNNKNIQRIYHTSNGSWKKKLDNIIAGYGYGGLDLGVLDMLVTGVSTSYEQEKEKILEK